MANPDTQAEGVAQVYGDVLLELAEEKGAVDSLLEELTDLATLLDADAAFDTFLSSPDIDASRRASVIEKTMRGRASDLFVNALQIINRKGRTDIIRAIVEAYRLAHEALHQQVDVHVTTAVPLTDELRQLLTEAASKYAGREAKLVESVDKEMLGGLTVRIGDTKLDSSLVSHLKRIRAALADRGLREILGDRKLSFVEGTAV